MLIKKYYIGFKDICDDDILPIGTITPYDSETLKNICDDIGITPSTLPFVLSNTYVEELWQRVVSRYYDDYLFTIKKNFNEDITQAEKSSLFNRWIEKFSTFVAQTYEYYTTLLGVYASAKAELMSDIKATSKNKVKFNDTPQNANTGDTYEGDNYITHFTKTEGETSSPLMSKMMRLKEIQDYYKSLMEDWCDKAEMLFIEEANV